MKLNLERKSCLSKGHRISIIKWLKEEYLKDGIGFIAEDYYENMNDRILIDELLMEIFNERD